MDTQIISEDLTNVIPVCDSTVEDCAVAESAVEATAATSEYPATDLWIFAGVSLINAIGPAIYYAVS